MRRFVLVVAVLLSACRFAAAQDMPLSQILIEGEGWTSPNGDFPSFPNPKLNTWNPPESVIIGFCHCMNLCIPPCARRMFSPGFRCR